MPVPVPRITWLQHAQWKRLCMCVCVSICTNVPAKQVDCEVNCMPSTRAIGGALYVSAHFTCFTGTRVLILTRRKAPADVSCLTRASAEAT
jgi:hypothetical protein